MPISLDFPEITDAFRKFLLVPVRQIAHHFEAIAAWLEKRVKAADLLERASREIPIVDFQGDAVVGWIDSIQASGLVPNEPVVGLGEHLRERGKTFIDGLSGNLKTEVDQELILPKLFMSLAEAVRAIENSVDRFAKSPSDMTDLLFGHSGVAAGDGAHRSAADLWGEAALAYRVIASSLNQFKALKDNYREAQKALKALSAGETGTGGAGPASPADAVAATSDAAARAPARETSFADTMDDISRFLLAGVLLLPAIRAFTVSFWQALSVRIKAKLLEFFAGIEARLNGIRQAVIRLFFTDLYVMIHNAISYTFAANKVLSANLRFFGDAALTYIDGLSDSLRNWLKDIGEVINKYIGYVNLVFDAVRAVLDIDIGKVLVAVWAAPLGVAGAALLRFVPKITLGDLIGAFGDAQREIARRVLTTFAEGVNTLVELNPLLSDSFISERLEALPDIFNNALRKYPDLPKAAAFKWPENIVLPDLFESFFAPGLANLRQGINNLGETTAQSVGNVVGAASVATRIIGDELESQAGQVNDAAISEGLRQVVATASARTHEAFGDDIEKMVEKIARSQRDPVAENFENWLAYGGFALLTDAIPAYLASARLFWMEKEDRGADRAFFLDKETYLNPTSPHILARRAGLSRVIVKRIPVKASGHEVDKSLAGKIAERFRAAVQQAYLDGLKRLELYGIQEG